MKVALAGAGAFGNKHLDAIQLIDGVEVVSLVGRELSKTQEIADEIQNFPCHNQSCR
jgi:2-hydroxy-4-carboxymuconate semialdehyde hemiacetal dehydrogenase